MDNRIFDPKEYVKLMVSGTSLEEVVGLACSEAKKRFRELGREDIEPNLKA
jgi:hypothetical protein